MRSYLRMARQCLVEGDHIAAVYWLRYALGCANRECPEARRHIMRAINVLR